MKNVVTLLSFILLLASCTQNEELQVPGTNTDADLVFQIIQQHNAQEGSNPIDITYDQIVNELASAVSNRTDCAAAECCYTIDQINDFANNWFGCTSGCPWIYDTNCDGLYNTLDLLHMSSNPCHNVIADFDMMLASNGVLYLTDQAHGWISNTSTIDGTSWTSSNPTITNTRWFVNGTPVTTNVNGMQLEYAGATVFDYAVPCNGYYEITLQIMVECQVYEKSKCVPLKMAGNSSCSSNYCTP